MRTGMWLKTKPVAKSKPTKFVLIKRDNKGRNCQNLEASDNPRSGSSSKEGL